MSLVKLAGAVVLTLGILALVYKGFTYTRETHEAKLGPIEFAVRDKERIAIPTWAGLTAVGLGAVLLATGRRR